MSPNGKKKIGMYWASSCGGCDISMLEIGPRILDLLDLAEIVFWPCVADFKYQNVADYADHSIDICFFNGGVRNSEQEEVARLLREKSRTLVAYGTCAADGGIPAMANLHGREAIFASSYHEGPTLDNPGNVEPQTRFEAAAGPLHLPEFYPAVLRLRDIVKVDYEIAGCPPQADDMWEDVVALLGGTAAASNGGLRIGSSFKTVCDECLREKRLTPIQQFQRPHQFRPEAGWCLLEQGLMCLGPATVAGCGALCPGVNMRCEGCYGAVAASRDQGTAMIGAIGTLLSAETEKQAQDLVGQIVDPAGTFYRFGMASSTLKFHK